MQDFVIFGLDDADRVLSRETLSVETCEAARQLARARLERFPRVEVWANWVCVYRGRRATAPTP